MQVSTSLDTDKQEKYVRYSSTFRIEDGHLKTKKGQEEGHYALHHGICETCLDEADTFKKDFEWKDKNTRENKAFNFIQSWHESKVKPGKLLTNSYKVCEKESVSWQAICEDTNYEINVCPSSLLDYVKVASVTCPKIDASIPDDLQLEKVYPTRFGVNVSFLRDFTTYKVKNE